MIIDTSANIDYAAFKVAFGRFSNSGQTCLAPDYIIVHESI
jgi:aldehyde dehydrogenase (NAD+)